MDSKTQVRRRARGLNLSEAAASAMFNGVCERLGIAPPARSGVAFPAEGAGDVQSAIGIYILELDSKDLARNTGAGMKDVK